MAFRDRASGPGAYRTLVRRREVYIHPSSALYDEAPDIVIFNETVRTSRSGWGWRAAGRTTG